MANSFGATSTTDDVLAGINLGGKRVLVTGVSAGLGVETARALVAHGAHVVGAARDPAKAERATSAIRAQTAMAAASNSSSLISPHSQAYEPAPMRLTRTGGLSTR